MEQLVTDSLSLRNLFLFRALTAVRANIRENKEQHSQLGFDDLVSILYNALHKSNGNLLGKAIRQHYPVAMIDEFQDTDRQQYGIFRAIYSRYTSCALLLIADPKQAIYSFRGADIFTYMYARSNIKRQYTLNTNWRSSSGMVSAVNQLFSIVHNPFIFVDIPFLPVSPAKANQELRFEMEGKIQKSLHICLQPGEGCGIAEYQQFLASQCAMQIRDWLTAGQQGKALLYTNKKDLEGCIISHPVKASHITILVRSRSEATVICNALIALKIPSVYLSSHDNVFQTPEASDLLWLLHAVLTPENSRFLRSAVATRLMGLNSRELDSLYQDENKWNDLISEFDAYRQHWQKQGFLSMLHCIIIKRNIAKNILASQEGERRLTNIFHIGELLQERSLNLDNAVSLLYWLSKKIENPDVHSDKERLRLESDNPVVQVMTIHHSKGMEFPIVWLPFIGSYRLQKKRLYHDRDNFNSFLDLNNNNNNDEVSKLVEEERLAEDLRLLYVALTRSIYHCSLGLAPIFSGKRKRQGKTDVHNSAIGYLIQNTEAGDSQMLLNFLKILESENIRLIKLKKQDYLPWTPVVDKEKDLRIKTFTRKMEDDWSISSYSQLHRQNKTKIFDSLSNIYEDPVIETAEDKSIDEFTQHTFPKGATSGVFLHRLLESLNFRWITNITWLTEQVILEGLNIAWIPVLNRWLYTIISCPLTDKGPCLAQLHSEAVQSELSFYVSIDRLIFSAELDALMKHHDPLSAQCPVLEFKKFRGMIKGSIDLVFYWQERYYILDYKSNWLGEDYYAYTQEAIIESMIEHRYDFQYQLYSLALHRHLCQRLPNYKYAQNFGGVIYCFLRGMNIEQRGQGIFKYRPSEELIEGMDKLFGYL
ncbi:exodeoxyribonuclease V subunit beta [Candidatus Profftia tarda]|uniref:exodeoxyribonuclease V subunit beta n=1 Tax=Candidatus Profftia tarda TaxID=1177216 RepID=UPI002A4E12D2|nr:exodeoxyribonuclease V subunit beta [Candidatus Profftia tarda]